MRKTLVILSPGFPENEADSTCIPDRQIFVRVLKETYPELNIIVVAFQYPFKANQYQWNGIEVIALGGKNKSGLYRRAIWMAAREKLKAINKNNNVIGLLSFWLDECALVAHKFAKENNLKHYCWLLGQDARPGNKYVKLIKPDGNNLIALSDFIVDEFTRNYNITPAHIVPGSIDPAVFKHYEGPKDIDVMGAGSLISLKQYAVFIDIIYALKQRRPGIKAIICGTGPERAALKEKIHQLNLEDNVSLLGVLPHDEVLALLQRTKVFLHTSNYEGFGIVCLEALYGGAKVVSFVRPMKNAINNWYVAENVADAQQQVDPIFADENITYQAVLPYKTQDAAKLVMAMFN